MKTKLILLAATLVVGFSSTSAIATPPGMGFYAVKVTPAVQAAHAARGPGLMSCCNTSARYTTGPGKGGVQANKSTACNTGCDVPHAGKNCSTTERKQCATKG
jgi:hypothetical protein